MQINRKRAFSVLWRWLALLLCLSFVLFVGFMQVKPLVFTAAKSRAETIILNAANTAVLNILNENNISYDNISIISKNSDGNITGIEIDTQKINLLKSLISNEMMEQIAKSEFYEVQLPLGTIFGSEYTTGWGPRLRFKMQLAETTVLNFESKFDDAGINNVLHQIIINMNISANVLMIGFTEGFNLSTSVLAAQTVIAGAVPESFTSVVERPGDDIADEIFNYSDH